MSFTYILLLTTFLGYPIITIILSKFIKLNQKISVILKPIILCFVVHNIFFSLGWSLRGNYIDYIIFSLEYFLICFTLFLLPAKVNWYLRIFRVMALVFVSIGCIAGVLGILLFTFFTQDYEPTRIFHFNNNDISYETRAYTAGAAFTTTTYTFETYRISKYLPIEKEINKINLSEFDTQLDMNDPNLQISIKKIDGHDEIQFHIGTQFIYGKPLN